jgi:hypothetical protein
MPAITVARLSTGSSMKASEAAVIATIATTVSATRRRDFRS